MARMMAVLIGGVLLGILGMLAVDRFGSPDTLPAGQIARDIADVPKIAEAVAERLRDERYTSLVSIKEIIALPTDFARSEALHALAGRSDSAGVQNLIFQANRIADDVERVSLLAILFSRLTEIDPHSALALARTEDIKGMKAIEQTVWRTWARKDLDDALFAAKAQASLEHQNSAAQSLYAAFGYMGNETTDRIEAELGIGPDRQTRGRYLYQLADRSPADAIAYINALERGTEQQEYVSWLAYYVSLRDPAVALRYADLFAVASDGRQYSNIINSSIARENPQAVIERWLAGDRSERSNRGFYSAISALASADLDAAKAYFSRARSSDDRRMFGSAIASEMARTDPAEAIEWARANDKEGFPYLQMSVLGRIAQTDPQLALTEALATPNAQVRSSMISNVLQHIAQDSPAVAVAYLDQIEDKQQKLEASQSLASSWVRHDPDAAIDWILSQDKETAAQMVQIALGRLLHSDLDAAIRLLPRVDEDNQEFMRQQIAQSLATSRSPAEAQAFIRQFAGQPGYDQLQASLISGLAQTDVLMAKQLADQLADGSARNRAYVQVIAQRAQTNPEQAMSWLRGISDESLRGVAAGQLAAQWYAQDPAAAARWVTGLPAGSSRDDAIVQMSSQWQTPTAEQQQLIASIEDQDKRGQAKIRQIYTLMRTNPARARELLQDEDIPSYQRQRIETMLSQLGSRY